MEETTPYKALKPEQKRQRLVEVAKVFLRLGTFAFGGPAAHIAMMDSEVVNKRQWMTREKLLDLLGVTNLIPGPNSTELAIHIGYERAGVGGLLVAGSCFILPAMLIVWGLAAIYTQYQTVPEVGGLLYGVKPVIVVIVVQALWNLGKKAAKDLPTIMAGCGATIAYFLQWNEVLVLILLGIAVAIVKNYLIKGRINGLFLFPLSGVLAQTNATTTTITSVSWGGVFWFFLKIGCVLYGSGYVLLAFLQQDLVERHHWLTSQQLLDAVAIGQVTPGPVFTTATFIGYLLAGNAGAIAGTVGIFLPAFVFVWLVNPWVSRLRQSSWMSGFLDGVNAASLGLMLGVTYTLGVAALVDWWTIILGVFSAVALLRVKMNSVQLILIGGVVGLALN